MREALTELLQEARAAGLPISVAESIDAIRAATVAGIERETLREALAAAVVKEEADRETFDDVFDRFFAAGDRPRKRTARRRSAGDESGGGRGKTAEGEGGAPRPEAESEPRQGRGVRPERPLEARAPTRPEARADVARRRRRRAILRKPFPALDPDELEELPELAEELSRRFRTRLARRHRRDRRGRLDFRRTIRASIAHGGAALELELRRRRRQRSDLVVLCDLSGSVRHAAELFAAIIAPCERYFRSLRVFAFVDRPVPAGLEHGRLIPESALDFHAFSDFGRTFVELERDAASVLTRNTLLVVLGDARTNRRPPRADALARLRARVRTLWWLVPEVPARWNTGDSALAAYAPCCDRVLDASTPERLVTALAALPA